MNVIVDVKPDPQLTILCLSLLYFSAKLVSCLPQAIVIDGRNAVEVPKALENLGLKGRPGIYQLHVTKCKGPSAEVEEKLSRQYYLIVKTAEDRGKLVKILNKVAILGTGKENSPSAKDEAAIKKKKESAKALAEELKGTKKWAMFKSVLAKLDFEKFRKEVEDLCTTLKQNVEELVANYIPTVAYYLGESGRLDGRFRGHKAIITFFNYLRHRYPGLNYRMVLVPMPMANKPTAQLYEGLLLQHCDFIYNKAENGPRNRLTTSTESTDPILAFLEKKRGEDEIFELVSVGSGDELDKVRESIDRVTEGTCQFSSTVGNLKDKTLREKKNA